MLDDLDQNLQVQPEKLNLLKHINRVRATTHQASFERNKAIQWILTKAKQNKTQVSELTHVKFSSIQSDFSLPVVIYKFLHVNSMDSKWKSSQKSQN